MNLPDCSPIVNSETCAVPSGIVSIDVPPPPPHPASGGVFVSETGDLLVSDLLLDKNEQSEGTGWIDERDETLAARWMRKQANVRLAHRIAEFDAKRADRMYKCAYELYRRTCAACQGNEQWSQDYRCGDRDCPICARFKAAESVRMRGPALEAYGKNLHASFLTLTYRNSKRLVDRARIAKNVRALVHRALWKEFGEISGGIYTVEVTFPRGEYHVHVHMLIYTAHPIPTFTDKRGCERWHVPFNQAVSDAWLEITGDARIVWGEAFDGRYAELLKYVAKPKDLERISTDQLREYSEWAKGMRAVATFGGLRGMEMETEREEPTECECGCKVVETGIFRVNARQSNYVCIDSFVNDPMEKLDASRYAYGQWTTKGP
jgi:hypothetical protein